VPETELRINLYFARGYETYAVEGTGWYLAATYPDADGATIEVIPRVRLPAGDVEKIAKVLDRFASGKPMNWMPNYKRSDSTLESVVHSANDQARDIVKEQLANAEELAKRLEALRARASEFDG
jgi:hypothetical protein